MWLTYSNVDTYFDGRKHFLLTTGFGEDVPQLLLNGVVAEITISEWMARRLSCGDETHQRLSNMGDKSGSRATTYVNPLVVRCGSRKVECAKHITSYVLVNGVRSMRWGRTPPSSTRAAATRPTGSSTSAGRRGAAAGQLPIRV